MRESHESSECGDGDPSAVEMFCFKLVLVHSVQGIEGWQRAGRHHHHHHHHDNHGPSSSWIIVDHHE